MRYLRILGLMIFVGISSTVNASPISLICSGDITDKSFIAMSGNPIVSFQDTIFTLDLDQRSFVMGKLGKLDISDISISSYDLSATGTWEDGRRMKAIGSLDRTSGRLFVYFGNPSVIGPGKSGILDRTIKAECQIARPRF